MRKARYAALTLREGDKLAAVLPPTACKDVLVVTRQGMAICFSLADVSVLGRTAAGVKAIQLAPNDRAIACIVPRWRGRSPARYRPRLHEALSAVGLRPAGARRQGTESYHLPEERHERRSHRRGPAVREARPFTVFQKSGAQAAFNTEEIAIETRAGKGQPYVLAVMGDHVEDVLMG